MSEKLRQLYARKHLEFPEYGASAKSHIRKVKQLADSRKWGTILDFGCGKAVLSKEIAGITNYDFAIPEYSLLPENIFDAAVCIDVLEHIPEDELTAVLQYLKTHAGNIYFCVHMGESIHKLADGEPCHCTVKPADWWLDKFIKHWNCVELVTNGKVHFTVLVSMPN